MTQWTVKVCDNVGSNFVVITILYNDVEYYYTITETELLPLSNEQLTEKINIWLNLKLNPETSEIDLRIKDIEENVSGNL